MSTTLAVVTGVGNIGFAATFFATVGKHRGDVPLYYMQDCTSGCDFSQLEYLFPSFMVGGFKCKHFGRGGCNDLWNAAVRLAHDEGFDNVIVMNDDIMAPKPGLFEQMIQVLDNNPHVAAVGVGSDGAWEGEHKHRERWFTDPSFLKEAADHCETFKGQPVKYVHHISGPCWGANVDLWLEAGGIDERFFWAFGEVQPCIELRNMGYQSVAVQYPVTICHYGGGAYFDIHADPARHESFLQRASAMGDEGKLFAEKYGTGHVHILAQEFDAKLPSLNLPPIQYTPKES